MHGNKGRKQTSEHVEKRVSSYRGKERPFNFQKHGGENHWNWKGESVSYWALHKYITFHRGRPKMCEICKKTDAKQYDWANKSHEYKRDLEDWIRLCRKCHIAYDRSAKKEQRIWNTIRAAN